MATAGRGSSSAARTVKRSSRAFDVDRGATESMLSLVPEHATPAAEELLSEKRKTRFPRAYIGWRHGFRAKFRAGRAVRTLRAFSRKEARPRSPSGTGRRVPWKVCAKWRLACSYSASSPQRRPRLRHIDLACHGEIARGVSCTYGSARRAAGECGATGTEEVRSAGAADAAARNPSRSLTEPAWSDAAHLAFPRERDGDVSHHGRESGISLAMCPDRQPPARTAPEEGEGRDGFPVAARSARRSRSPLPDMGSHSVGRACWPCDTFTFRSHRLEKGQGFYRYARFDYNRVGIALSCRRRPDLLRKTMPTSRAPRLRQCRGLEGRVLQDRRAATHARRCRGLCYRSLWLRRTGPRTQKESAMDSWAQLAVETSTSVCSSTATTAIPTSCPFEQRNRDVIGLEIGERHAEVYMSSPRAVMGAEPTLLNQSHGKRTNGEPWNSSARCPAHQP